MLSIEQFVLRAVARQRLLKLDKLSVLGHLLFFKMADTVEQRRQDELVKDKKNKADRPTKAAGQHRDIRHMRVNTL